MPGTSTIERRQRVARLRQRGLSTWAIAAEVGCAQSTVRYDLSRLSSAQADAERVERSERAAIRADARRRLPELRRAALLLWGDRDDPMVAVELLSIASAIRAAEGALR